MFLTLPFSHFISSSPSIHHTAVHVHEPFFLLAQSLPSYPLPLTVIMHFNWWCLAWLLVSPSYETLCPFALLSPEELALCWGTHSTDGQQRVKNARTLAFSFFSAKKKSELLISCFLPPSSLLLVAKLFTFGFNDNLSLSNGFINSLLIWNAPS